MDTQLSSKELKETLREVLKNSGILDGFKAQMRKELACNLSLKLTSSSAGPGQSNPEKSYHFPSKPLPFAGTLHDRILFSLIYNFLLKRKFKSTVSVFVAESGSGLNEKKDKTCYALSEEDILTALQIHVSSKMFQQFKAMENVTTTTAAAAIATDTYKLSLLEHVINHVSSNRSRSEEISTQTEYAGIGALELVDIQLKDARSRYSRQLEDQRLTSLHNNSIDERMLEYQKECEDRYKRELESKINYMRDNEMCKVRLEEKRLARLDVEVLRKELEGDYKKRLQSNIEREGELNRRHEEKERFLQQSLYDARQMMQREIDDLKVREQSSFRRLELETQGLHVLELRLQEASNVLTNREKELTRRELGNEETVRRTIEKIREDAKEKVGHEMMALINERSAVMVDRTRVEEEKLFNVALVESGMVAREQLKDAQALVIAQSDEIARLNHRIERLDNIYIEEKKIECECAVADSEEWGDGEAVEGVGGRCG